MRREGTGNSPVHLGNVPGAQVKIEQYASIQDARASEARIIKRQQPKYNDQDK